MRDRTIHVCFRCGDETEFTDFDAMVLECGSYCRACNYIYQRGVPDWWITPHFSIARRLERQNYSANLCETLRRGRGRIFPRGGVDLVYFS